MSNTFSFVGYLKPIKEKENFKGFTATKFDSGWMTERLRFNVIAGDNRHLVEINAGRWQQEDKNVIYGFTKPENGKKGEPFQIPWNERTNPDMIDRMAGWRVFTVDLDTYNHRQELEQSGDTEGLAKANSRRKHFLVGTDFCEYVNKVVNSDKIKDMKFRVNGTVNYTYSEKNDRYYSTYEVTKIYRIDDDKDPESTVNIDFYFAENPVDSEDYAETGKAIANGYTAFYDNSTKKNWYCPISLVMRFGTDDKGKKKVKGWEKIFGKFEDDTIRRMVLECEQIDGAQKVDISYDDLSDNTKEMIDFGIISLEDAIKDAGGSVYDDTIHEIRIKGPGKGFYKGSETTVYSLEDMKKKPSKEVEKEKDTDLFDDEDDIL